MTVTDAYKPLSEYTDTPKGTASGHIKIEINKEDSIISFLTKDHKANMSLLFYDFNNANQRLQQKKQRQNQPTNLADDVIPEEAEDQGANAPYNNNALSGDDDDDSLYRPSKRGEVSIEEEDEASPS